MAFLNNHDITQSNLIVPRGLFRWLRGVGHCSPARRPDELKLK